MEMAGLNVPLRCLERSRALPEAKIPLSWEKNGTAVLKDQIRAGIERNDTSDNNSSGAGRGQVAQGYGFVTSRLLWADGAPSRVVT